MAATSGAENLKRGGHVVCLPFTTQSHIGAMLKLAKLFHHRGFHVSFVNSEFNHRRLIEARGGGGLTDDDDLPSDFQFLAISDGLPPSQANASQNTDDLAYGAKHGMAAPFCDLIGDLNRKAAVDVDFPAVSCIVSDGFMTFCAKPAADKYTLPNIYFWTISACGLLGFMQGPAVIDRGFCPLKDESSFSNDYLDTIVIDWIPGMKNMRLRDLPSFIRTTDINDIMLNFVMEVTERVNEATATIIHTFEALEQDVLDDLSSILSQPLYAVGPLHIILNKIIKQENHLKHAGCSLLEEDIECLKWLDSQKANSVLYINFGSVAHLTQRQFVEFAMGVANSGQPFLWIIRPDLVIGENAIIPMEFIEETKGRGLLSSWCPQEEVLNHHAVGGFLTHCGWNSILESLSVGMPMLCWPYFGDQPTNCKYTCAEWLVGLEIDSVVMRDNVESLVREIMVEEKGKQLKISAMKWKELANEATDPHGSSLKNLDKLFGDLLSNRLRQDEI